MSLNLVAVDTGLRALGWAMWLDVERGEPIRTPDRVGVIDRSKAKGDWWDRGAAICREFVDGPLYSVRFGGNDFPRDPVQVLEMPEFRPGSAVGHAAASEESLGMLYFMCGLHRRAGEESDVKTAFLRVREWKGSLSKAVVEKRLRRVVGDRAADGTQIESHCWDAVGIGLRYLGHRIDDHKKFGAKT